MIKIEDLNEKSEETVSNETPVQFLNDIFDEYKETYQKLAEGEPMIKEP